MGPPGLPGPPGYPGQKGEKGEKGESVSFKTHKRNKTLQLHYSNNYFTNVLLFHAFSNNRFQIRNLQTMIRHAHFYSTFNKKFLSSIFYITYMDGYQKNIYD